MSHYEEPRCVKCDKRIPVRTVDRLCGECKEKQHG